MLYKHVKHPHTPVNTNLLHRAELAEAAINQRIAVVLAKIFQSMITFWLIMLWFGLWIAGNATFWGFDKAPWPLLLTLASAPQLPIMIALGVGIALLGRKQELQAEETYQFTEKTYHDTEQMIEHLSEQDRELLKQTAELLKQTPMIEQVLAKLDDHEVLLKALTTTRGRAKA